MDTIIRAFEAWVIKIVLNALFGVYSAIFNMLVAAYNYVIPAIADILMINPFGKTAFTRSGGGVVLDLTSISSFVKTVSGAVEFIGIELVILLGLYGMLKASASLIELKRAEHIFQHFLKMGICIWAVSHIYDIMATFFDIFLGVNNIIVGKGGTIQTGTGYSYDTESVKRLLQGVSSVKIDKSQVFIEFLNGVDVAGSASTVVTLAIPTVILAIVILIILLILTVISCIKIFASIFDIGKEMIARLVRFYLHLVIAPLVIPCALTESTKQSFRSYFTSFAGVSLEWVLSMELIFIIGRMLAVTPKVLVPWFIDLMSKSFQTSGQAVAGLHLSVLFAPCVLYGVYALLLSVLKSLMSKLDSIAKGMLALGGI